MRQSLDQKLAEFMRRNRGGMSFVQFSRKTGLPPSTPHRLENGGQSITLSKLQQVLQRLKGSITEVFKYC